MTFLSSWVAVDNWTQPSGSGCCPKSHCSTMWYSIFLIFATTLLSNHIFLARICRMQSQISLGSPGVLVLALVGLVRRRGFFWASVGWLAVVSSMLFIVFATARLCAFLYMVRHHVPVCWPTTVCPVGCVLAQCMPPKACTVPAAWVAWQPPNLWGMGGLASPPPPSTQWCCILEAPGVQKPWAARVAFRT